MFGEPVERFLVADASLVIRHHKTVVVILGVSNVKKLFWVVKHSAGIRHS